MKKYIFKLTRHGGTAHSAACKINLELINKLNLNKI